MRRSASILMIILSYWTSNIGKYCYKIFKAISFKRVIASAIGHLGPVLLTWINFSPSMDEKSLAPLKWDEINYQRLSLKMDN